MFYSVNLPSHLSIDEKALNDYIKLNKINRNFGIVMDSDKKNNDDDLNNTVKRIQQEFINNKCFV